MSVLALGVSGWALFWILFYSFATYANAGWMREQVCLYMCPYARFQSAMFDKNTLIISYDQERGEPRTKGKRTAASAGDCIDFTLCVQVCPTGIDLRDGLQYECIGCAACIDVCDEVMEKTNRPAGLIRYTTENAIAGKPTRIVRPKSIIYATTLLCLFIGLLWSIGARDLVEIDVIRDRNTLFRESDDGFISNSYTVKVINKTEQEQRYTLVAEGIRGLTLSSDEQPVMVEAGDIKEVAIQLQVHYENLSSRASDVRILINSTQNPKIESSRSTRFLGPATEE